MIESNFDTPLFKLTVGEFLEVLNAYTEKDMPTETSHGSEQVVVGNDDRKYVYGIDGIARLFGCSKPTANRIKKSGRIDGAITQIGRKIIVDAEKAIQLAGMKKGGRGSCR